MERNGFGLAARLVFGSPRPRGGRGRRKRVRGYNTDKQFDGVCCGIVCVGGGQRPSVEWRTPKSPRSTRARVPETWRKFQFTPQKSRVGVDSPMSRPYTCKGSARVYVMEHSDPAGPRAGLHDHLDICARFPSWRRCAPHEKGRRHAGKD